ncbi:neutral/alkaline non-lysosomal ceramidase N-terminal domain-containing protein [Roseimaritima sediminicola]|uniref:neutral/alkaline non-lysosomal ceramidase N-terminal domain-containing protein n=1 Tax=Roseimaritima sediminicola TaxID=2662066 RepID=UPI00129825BD|nr:neutral/alkaline non-lysosomal ceramidase N-terminal domain-containing protein [Roseimaritima sediminicola]
MSFFAPQLFRRYQLFLNAALVLALACLIPPRSFAAEQSEGQTYRVGVAKRDITPEYPVRLNGFGMRETPSEGVSQPIWTRALAIEADEAESPVVIVTLDNLGIRYPMVQQVARRVAATTDLLPDNLIVTFTHTHSAPKVNGASDNIFAEPIPEADQQAIDRYTAELTEHLVAVVQQALGNLRPATLHWGVGEVGFAKNRRTAGGPVDHSLPCLIVRSAESPDDILALYTTYACHCVTLSHNQIDGDWAGYAANGIERYFPDAVAMVSIGCGSDQNPDSGVTGDKVQVARRQGMQIADEVARLIRTTDLQPLSGPVRAAHTQLQLPFETLPSRAEYQAMAEAGGAAGYNAQTQLARLDAGHSLPTALDYPIHVCSFGDQLCMVFLAGEVCVDYAIRLRGELDGSRIWMHGYSQDFGAYIPSERLLREGGYGGGAEIPYFALPTRLAGGLEDKIVSAVHRLVPEAFHQDKSDGSKSHDASKTGGTVPLAPEDSLQKMQAAPGLEVRLVASEPQISDPVAIDFGPKGDLWVVQMSDYGHGIEEEFVPRGEVRVLDDRDGDGHFETARVFAAGLRYPTGVKVWRDGALICDAPHIYFSRDTDGDGVEDSREILFTGFATHNGQARVNSLRWGLDNWLYGSGGLFGGEITNAKGQTVDVSGRDFRIRPDQGIIEPVTGRSQQGRCRDDWGNWFGCSNSQLLTHFPVDDTYAGRNPFVAPPPSLVSVPRGPEAGKLYPLDNLVLFRLSGAPGKATAACGVGVYRDRLLGEGYSGNAFTCEPVNQLVYRQVLSRQGAHIVGHRAEEQQESEFLRSSDQWFRPVQVRTGPDGGLWVVDMYRYVIEHPKWIPDETLAQLDVFAGQDRGRIYRVVPADKTAEPRRSPLDLDSLEPAQLAQQLDSPNGIVRDLAHQMLLWQSAVEAKETLHELVQTGTHPAARIHALSVLAGLDLLTAERLGIALEDPSAHVRQHAVRWSEPLLDQPALQRAILKLAADPAYPVRRQAAYALAHLPPEPAAPVLARLATKDTDAYLRAAALSSLTPENVGAVAQIVLDDASLRDQIGNEVLATAAGTGTAATVRQVLDGLLAGQHSAAQPWRLRYVAEWLDGLDRRVREGQLRLVPASGDRSSSAAAAVRLTPDDHLRIASLRRHAYRIVTDTSSDDRSLQAAFALLGRGRGPATQALLNDTADSSDPTDSSDTADPSGPADSSDPAETPHTAASGDTLSPAATSRALARWIDLPIAKERQLWAIAALKRRGGPADAAALLDRLDFATPQVRTAIIESLVTAPAWNAVVLEALTEGVIRPVDIASDHRQAFIERQSPARREEVAGLLVDPQQQDRAALVRQWQDVAHLPTDPQAGQQAFIKHCSVCHKYDGVGHEVGPDLGGLTSRATPFLLTAILNPNRDVDARYQRYTALTDDGRLVSGQLATETATSITLLEQGGKQHVLLRNQLEELTPSGQSAMPEGLEKQIDKQQLANIIAYLQGAGSPARQWARQLLDPEASTETRVEMIQTTRLPAADLIEALTVDLPAGDSEEEYRRIPWIWRVAIAAGKRNQSEEILSLLDASLPATGQPLADWQSVVIGGGLINGISQAGDWPLDRIQRLVAGSGDLPARWNHAVTEAAAMADDVRVASGTRYDALRMIALAPWSSYGTKLVAYLDSDDADLQMGAVSGLADMPAAEAGDALLASLAKLTQRNRQLAIAGLRRTELRALRLLRAVEAGDALAAWFRPEDRRALKTHPSDDVRRLAAQVLR